MAESLWHDEHDDVDGGISMEFEALQADLFGQTKAIKWRCIALFR